MKLRRCNVLGAILVALLPQSVRAQGAAPAGQPLVVQHVTVIDVERGRPLPDRTVLIRGNRIAAVTPASHAQVPPAARVVDGRGKFLIPGLWDMHVHAAEGVATWWGTLFVANGVTGVRDTWGRMDAVRAWRQREAAGDSATPRLVAAGHLLDGSPPIWAGSLVATSAQSARHAVDSLQAAGAPFIKVYSMLSREAYFAAAEEAKARGLPFAGHVPLRVAAAEASDAGQRSIEHLTGVLLGCSSIEAEVLRQFATVLQSPGAKDSAFAFLAGRTHPEILAAQNARRCRDLASRFRRNHTWQTPTLTMLHNYAYQDDPALSADPRLEYLPKSIVLPWKSGSRSVTQRELANAKASYKVQLGIVGQLFRGGVPILAGTDVNNPFCMPGFSLHDELVRLVEAGLPPAEALKTATLNPARFFEATDSLGTVAPRKLADLVLLDADPLTDIHNTTRIRAVILNGLYLDRSALDRMLEARQRRVATVVDSALAARAGYETVMGGLRDAFLRNAVAPGDMAKFLTNDFVLVMPDGSALRGPGEMEKYFQWMFSLFQVTDFTYKTTFFRSDGAHAYARGIERNWGVLKKDGKPVTDAFQFLAIYERQPDGRWLLQSVMNTPVPQTAQSGSR